MIQYVVKNTKITMIFVLAFMVAGVISYTSIPRQENPDVTSPTAVITTIYPGASSEEVESLITSKIEVEVSTIEGIESIESISSSNVSVVIVTINYSVDKDEQWSTIEKSMSSLTESLPEGAYPPIVDTESMVETTGMILALHSKKYDYESLEYFSETIKDELLRIGGIKKINIEGSPQKRVVIELLPESISQTDLSVEDIYNLVLVQNLEIPSGSIETSSGNVGVSIPGTFSNLQDIKSLIVNISDNLGIVRLGDIANIYMDYETDTKKFEVNGDSAVLLTTFFKENQNIIEIGKEVDLKLESLVRQLPDDLEITKVTFQPADVSESVNRFILNLLQGVLFVVIVILLGMGFYNATIVSTAMPFSILLTFVFMRFFQIDIHQISIAALIISLGILVDNSIVVIDAIQHQLDRGVTPAKAAITGAFESSSPVFTSTLTTIAAFAPLIALPGEAGEFARSLPIVVIIALSASYLSAMFFVPSLAFLLLGKKQKKPDSKKYWIKGCFTKALSFGLKHSRVTLITIFSFFILSIGIGIYFLPIEIFPYADKTYFYIDIENEKKGDMASTRALVDEICSYLDEEPTVKSYTSSVGGSLPKFYLTVAPNADADHIAQILAYVEDDANDLETFVVRLEEDLRQNVIGSQTRVHLPAITAPGPEIEIILYGKDRAELNTYASDIFDQVNELQSISSTHFNLPHRTYQYEMAIDSDYATLVGLTSYDIQRQVNIALNGANVSKLRTIENEYDIYLTTQINQVTDLENLLIKSSITNQQILLKQVTNLQLRSQVPIIHRYNRLPSVTIECYVDNLYNTQTTQRIIEKMVYESIDSTSLSVDFRGEKETLTKYLGGIAEAALYALVAIFLILLIQFKSSRQALIILATVPLSIIGSMAGLYIFRQPFSFTAGLGLASLIGIVVNNAILLLEYINRGISSGVSIQDACLQSLDRRFRPIMLSTITTIMGLFPLALSGSSFFTPMAVTLMSGLFVSTFFTLIIIPTMYHSIFKHSAKK